MLNCARPTGPATLEVLTIAQPPFLNMTGISWSIEFRTPQSVGVENPAIFGFGRLIERSLPFNAGIVKGDVELAIFVGREIDHRFNICISCDVSADKCRIAAELLNFP